MNSKYERFSINLLHRDKVALRRLAHATGEAMSTVVRRLVRQEAQRYGLLSPITLDSRPGRRTSEVRRE